MISKPTEATAEAGVGWVKYAISTRLGWLFREQPSQDKGIDAEVEEVLDGQATGHLIKLQIKSGACWFRHKTATGYLYRGDLKHLTYWQGHSLPVLIVLFDPEACEAYWQLVPKDQAKCTARGWTIVVPYSQRLNGETVQAWQQIALPEAAKRFLQRKQRFQEIARAVDLNPERRQTLIYEALSLCRNTVCVATPFISADILSVLDFVSVRCRVQIVIGTTQPPDVRTLLRLRSRPGFEVRVCPNMHLKMAIFDSLFLMRGSANLTPLSIACPSERLFVDEVESESALQAFFDAWQNPLALPVQELTGRDWSV